MITMTPTSAPADLLGLGGPDMSAAYGSSLRCAVAERAVAANVPSQGTGLPAGGAAVRLRPVVRRPISHGVVTSDGFDSNKTFENNGTTLGYHSSGRPQS